MEDLCSAGHKSVVDESSSTVLSLLKRECVGAHCQMRSERVRRLSERAPQKKGLECSRRATHKWLSQNKKGGAGPAHRWCGEEDAPGLPLVVRESQGNFTADPQCVAEMCAHEWKREWSGEDAIGFVKEMNSIRALREKHVAEARVWASNLDSLAEPSATNCHPSCTSQRVDHNMERFQRRYKAQNS